MHRFDIKTYLDYRAGVYGYIIYRHGSEQWHAARGFMSEASAGEAARKLLDDEYGMDGWCL